jgi:hypothetical protein
MRKGLRRWSAAATAGDCAVASSVPSSSDAKNSANDSAPAITWLRVSDEASRPSARNVAPSSSVPR